MLLFEGLDTTDAYRSRSASVSDELFQLYAEIYRDANKLLTLAGSTASKDCWCNP